MKGLFPHGRSQALNVVALNTAGGMTGGDRFEVTLAAEEAAALVFTTQAAERGYRAVGAEPGRSSLRLAAGPSARIDWLPQETILYDGARLHRRIEADLAPDARLLLVEPIVFGRMAMGESCRSGALVDQWRIRRDGKLVFADALRIGGDIAARLDRPAIGAGARAIATLLYLGPEAAHLAKAVRPPAPSGAALIADDILLVRLLVADGFALRQALVPLVERLSGRPVPKVWSL